MKSMRSRIHHLLLMLLLGLTTPSFAAGTLSYTTQGAVINAVPGETIRLNATLRNTGNATLYVNDVATSFNGPAASYFSRNLFFRFFNSVPGTFEIADPTFTGEVEEVLIAPGTPAGTYTVTVGIMGGDDPTRVDPTNDTLGSQTFTVIVGPGQLVPFFVTSNGAVSVASTGGAAAVAVGHGIVQPTNGSTTPAGLAIIGFRENNVLVSEAGVPATPAITSGRIYAEVGSGARTGIAIANPNSQPALVSFFFTNVGANFRNGTTTIPANGQVSAFLDQPPFNGPESTNGSFTFSSSVLVAATAIRGLVNERGDFLMTTLPVKDLTIPATTSPLVFPHIADGSGWTTRIVLVNDGDSPVNGTVQFITRAGTIINTSPYSIPARSAERFDTTGVFAGTSAGTSGGWARTVPGSNTASPSGFAIFSYRNAGVTVTEASVPAVAPAIAFRLYAEAAGAFGSAGSMQSGLAVVNTSATPATVTVELTKLDGAATGLSGTLSVSANGQTAVFLNQIPGLSLPTAFRGIARVSSTSPISVTPLRARYNERLDFLVTTTPAVDEATAVSTAPVYFPQLADSGGYTTQFVIFNATTGAGGGNMKFYSQNGGAMDLQIQ